MRLQISLLIDRNSPDTLTDQLTSQFRDAIRLGRIPSGARLPSSRRLAEQLAIGRNTVVRAYETLEIERFVEARPASGMFASLPPTGHIGIARAQPAQPVTRAAEADIAGASRLSFDFQPGQLAPSLFPIKTWRRALHASLSQGGVIGLTQSPDPLGLAALRAAVATHLAAARGLAVEPAQVLITSGVTEAVLIAAKIAISPGALVALENPGAQIFAASFEEAGARLYPVPLDEEGMIPEELPASQPALLVVTPSHQFPTGRVMSRGRREQIAAYATRADCLILEDDRGSDFSHEGGLPPAIASLAPERTLYVNSFSQSLGAGLRIGYLVIPGPLAAAARAAKPRLTNGSPWLEQAAIATMMTSGGYAAHIMRMQPLMRQRRDALLQALRGNYGGADISGEASGLHLFWQLPPGVPDASAVEALARRSRVGVYALETTRVWHPGSGSLRRRGLMLGYGGLTPPQIAQGIARLSDAVDDALDRHTIDIGDLLTHRTTVTRVTPVRGKPAPRLRHKPALSGAASSVAESRMTRATGQRMTKTSASIVTGLFHYPIKGLSPQVLDTVAISEGQPFPFDRMFALARPGVGITPENPAWAKKGLFVMLMLFEALASVRTHLDPSTGILTVRGEGRELLRADVTDDNGRASIQAFFHELAPALREDPILVRATRDGHFMDKPDNVISLINVNTVREVEERFGQTIDPLRFRANIYIDDAPAWSEFDWVGGEVRVGQGVFRADRRNGRCGATNVDPWTGRRDRDIPGGLRRTYGHKDLGIYLVALNDARLSVGDAVIPPGTTSTLAAVPAQIPVIPGRRAYICRGCYYIYQEALGAPAAGISPGTAFADLPDGWRCPDCGTDRGTFRPYGAGE